MRRRDIMGQNGTFAHLEMSGQSWILQHLGDVIQRVRLDVLLLDGIYHRLGRILSFLVLGPALGGLLIFDVLLLITRFKIRQKGVGQLNRRGSLYKELMICSVKNQFTLAKFAFRKDFTHHLLLCFEYCSE